MVAGLVARKSDRAQGRDEWQRDQRQAAYIQALGSAHTFWSLCVTYVYAPTLEAHEAMQLAFHALGRDGSGVQIVGPDDVADAATELVAASHALILEAGDTEARRVLRLTKALETTPVGMRFSAAETSFVSECRAVLVG